VRPDGAVLRPERRIDEHGHAASVRREPRGIRSDGCDTRPTLV
jgi:hypothetical protein